MCGSVWSLSLSTMNLPRCPQGPLEKRRSNRPDQTLARFLATHHWCLACSSGVCMLLLKGGQTLVISPTSILQQSLVNTVPHIPWWCSVIYLVQGKNFKIWPKSGLTFWQHIVDVWCLTSSYSMYVACRGLSVLGIGNWTQQAYCNNHWWIQCLSTIHCSTTTFEAWYVWC